MIIRGHLLRDPFQPPEPGWLQIVDDRILRVETGDPPDPPDLGDEHLVICTGFIDAHVHLPQIDSVGFDGLELLDWLNQIIFPAEAAWSDHQHADDQALEAYRRMLKAGTLGFGGYLTSHHHSVIAATRAAHRIPLRAAVGQVLMDRFAPEQLWTDEVARLLTSERGRLQTTLNPRFAVSCSDDLLRQTGDRVTDDLIIQTHLAETQAECELIANLFPDDANYTAIYDRHGLLTPRTLLAHGIYLAPEEWALIADRESVVVHCPTANTFLEAGLFDLRAACLVGARVALGSDVAGGPDLSMPRVARAMIEVQKLRRMTIDEDAVVPSPEDAWSMITRVNADALGWNDAGRLDPGAAADLLMLRTPFDPSEPGFIGRLLYTWTDDYIAHRIVAGRPIELD